MEIPGGWGSKAKKTSSRWAPSERLKIANFENKIDYWMIPFKNGMAFNKVNSTIMVCTWL